MALSGSVLAVVVSLFRTYVGGGAFDRIRREFDLMSRTGLSGKERREAVVEAMRTEFPKLAEAVVLVAIQLLWLQVPAGVRAQVESIGSRV
jgi:hypothetical protein